MIYAGILLLLASVAVTSGVLAKYADSRKQDPKKATAKSFYFESDYLTADDHLYKLNAGTTSIDLKLYNYENELRFSEVACTYTITVVSDDATVTIGDTQTKQTSVSVEGGTRTDTEITVGGLEDGYEYKVTVVADGGYQKTLGAIFSVAPAQRGLFMNVNASNAEYVVLTVWSENVSGEVKISVPAGLIPDTTDPIMTDITNYGAEGFGAFEFTDSESFSKAYSSHSYRFFKSADFVSATGFAVTMGDSEATERNIP